MLAKMLEERAILKHFQGAVRIANFIRLNLSMWRSNGFCSKWCHTFSHF